MTRAKRFCGRPSRRKGATLIDVATGAMLLSVLLIPSMHLMARSKSNVRRVATRESLMFEADQVLESTIIALGEPSTFSAVLLTPVDTRQAITVNDVPNVVSRVRAGADTSVPSAQLLTLIVDVWQDSNRNGAFEAGEPHHSLRTQLAAP